MILCREPHAKAIDKAIFPGTQGGPLEHVIAAKAVSFREALQPEFKQYCQAIVENAKALAAALTNKNFQVVSGGTDNHLFLMDLVDRRITGKDADAALGRANITVNKNAVPNDPRPPMVTSGLRVGTPAATTRGFREREVEQVADLMAEVLDAEGDAATVDSVRARALDLCRSYPVYGS